MKTPFKPLKPNMSEMRDAMGVPSGKPMSVKNMVRATPPITAKKKRPKPGSNPSGGYTYA